MLVKALSRNWIDDLLLLARQVKSSRGPARSSFATWQAARRCATSRRDPSRSMRGDAQDRRRVPPRATCTARVI